MILDIDKMDYEERRKYLVLTKDMLRQMSEESLITFKHMCAYEDAYNSITRAIKALDEENGNNSEVEEY